MTLSVGEHVRLPRTYRGRDVLWWMDAAGVWDQRYDEVEDLTRARRLPSPQLVGTPERTTLDLNALASMGVELVGRWAAVRDGRALFSGGLRNVFSLADLKMERLLDTFDEWAKADGYDAEVGPPERFAPTRVPESTRLQLDLRSGEIRTIVWATGFRPDYGWLDVPVVDAKGQLHHEGGVVGGAGTVRAGAARAAAAQVHVHLRYRGRRARGDRSPRAVPGRAPVILLPVPFGQALYLDHDASSSLSWLLTRTLRTPVASADLSQGRTFPGTWASGHRPRGCGRQRRVMEQINAGLLIPGRGGRRSPRRCARPGRPVT